MRADSRTSHDGLWLYMALTFAFSWIVWFLVPLLGMTGRTFPGMLLFMIGGFVPSIVGVFMVYRNMVKADRADFWRRVWDARQVRPGWWALLVLGIPVLIILSIWLDGILFGGTAGMDALKQVAGMPVAWISLVMVGIIAGPVSEELGWRGFALDRMAARWGMPRASLILGVIWWAWHLPLFFVPDTSHNQWGLFTLPFWAFFPTVIGLSVIIARAYADNGRSIFAAILAHFMYNFMLSLVFPITGEMMMIFALLLAAWVVVLLVWRRPFAPVSRKAM